MKYDLVVISKGPVSRMVHIGGSTLSPKFLLLSPLQYSTACRHTSLLQTHDSKDPGLVRNIQYIALTMYEGPKKGLRFQIFNFLKTICSFFCFNKKNAVAEGSSVCWNMI